MKRSIMFLSAICIMVLAIFIVGCSKKNQPANTNPNAPGPGFLIIRAR